MEKKKLYEGPEILVYPVEDVLSTGGSTEIGGGYPSEWE